MNTLHFSNARSMWRAALSLGLPFLMAFWVVAASVQIRSASADTGLEWRDTGIALPTDGGGSSPLSRLCFDSTRASSVLVPEQGDRWTSVNLNTGQRTAISGDGSSQCAAGGKYFNAGDLQAYRITDLPDADHPDRKSHLMYTSDGGRTWVERTVAQAPGGRVISVAASRQDPSAVYVSVAGAEERFTIYYSSNAGVTWERRFVTEPQGIGSPVYWPTTVEMLPGDTAPVDTVQITSTGGGMGSGKRWSMYVSVDGGRTFNPVGTRALGTDTQLVYTSGGILRLGSNGAGGYGLSYSDDGGKTWQPRAAPWPAERAGNMQQLTVSLQVVDTAPDNVFLYDRGASTLYYSPDGGRTWKQTQIGSYVVSPFVPLTVVGVGKDSPNLLVLDLPNAGKSLVGGVKANNAPGGTYFSPTKHNLWGPFKKYWDANGGLAQFGYARTEPFLEVSATNGRAYLVQYFERNRFEYHPESRGTPYDVQLGLLGVQLTEEYRRSGHGAFNRFDDPHVVGQLYFGQTGHTLRHSFKQYWEAHGGLALYGYPVSEEFEEVNPEDGKTYVVQYFERNRFEWHPENVGTPYEVLLGALGNTLLKLKGWE